MLKLSFFTLTYFIVLSAWSQACELSVSGFVFDRVTEEPLPFATVQIEGTTLGAVTSENGFFEIKGICDQEVHIHVSMVGYKTIIHHHDVYHAAPLIYMASDARMLESIIIEDEEITSEFLSMSTQQLDQKSIARLSTRSLGDLSANISGVSTISTGQNIVKPVIHGLHSNRILIINNELRHEFQNWGIEHAPEIDANNVNMLEVIKGASAVKYGPDALGGVILVKNAQPRLHDSFYGNVSSRLNSNGRGIASHLNAGFGEERWAVHTTGSWQQTGDLKAPDYLLTNTGNNQYSWGGSALYHGSNLELETEVIHNYQQLGILRGSVTGNLEDLVLAISSDRPLFERGFDYQINPPYQEVSHLLGRLKGTYRNKGHFFTLQYGYQNNHRKEIDIRRGSASLIPSINLELTTHSLDAEWRLPAYDQWTISLGSQSMIQDNNNLPGTNTIPFVPNFNNYRTGLFGIFAFNQTHYALEAGIRFDVQYSSIRGRLTDNSLYQHQINFSNLTGSVGWVRFINANQNIRLNVGTAWRPPNISELYSFGKHQNALEYGLWRYTWSEEGSLIAGIVRDSEIENIKPEKGAKIIGSWNYRSKSIQAEVGVYAHWIQNYLYTRPAGLTNTVRGAFPYFIYDQTTAGLTGIDIDATWYHSDRVGSQFSASFIYARDVQHQSYFLNMPPFNFRHQLNWQMFNRKSVVVDFSFVNQFFARQWMALPVIAPQDMLDAYAMNSDLISDQTAPFDIAEAPDGYVLSQLQLNLESKLFTYQLKVNNLFAQSYRMYTDRLRYYADQPGRDLSISISYQW